MDWDAAKSTLHENEELTERLDDPSVERRRRVLLERARALSTPAARPADQDRDMILVFRSGGHRRAVLLAELGEVIADVRRTVVPGAPAHVAGLVQLRGNVLPVYHLGSLLGGSDETAAESEFVLLLRGAGREFAVLAAEIEDVRQVPRNKQRPAQPGSAHARWVTEDLITVLDVESLAQKER